MRRDSVRWARWAGAVAAAVVVLGLVVPGAEARPAVAAAAVAPAATAPTPRHALAVVGGGARASGYSDVAGCRWASCRAYGGSDRYPFDNWATDDRVRIGGIGGRIVVLTPARIRTLSSATYQQLASAAVQAPTGWSWAGGLVGTDGYVYVLWGRVNRGGSADFVAGLVRKYDTSGRILGQASISAGLAGWGGVYALPSGAGATAMTISGRTLLVHTNRLHVRASDGVRHQSNLTVAVDTRTMTATRVDGAYASHSFAQYVRTTGDDAVFLDHGDAYPRASVLTIRRGLVKALDPSRCPRVSGPGCDPSRLDIRRPRVVGIPGAVGDNTTGLTVNGLEVGRGRALTVGVSVPHRRALHGVTGSGRSLLGNAYVTSTRLSTGGTTYRWLTAYHPRSNSKFVGEPRIARVGPNRFAVLFTVFTKGKAPRLHYRLIGPAGTVLASRSWRGLVFAPLSQPALVGGTLVWADLWRKGGTTRRYLVGLNVADPTRPRWLTRPAS